MKPLWNEKCENSSWSGRKYLNNTDYDTDKGFDNAACTLMDVSTPCPSQECIDVSLEVEIDSPLSNKDVQLLDVTIVQPSNYNNRSYYTIRNNDYVGFPPSKKLLNSYTRQSLPDKHEVLRNKHNVSKLSPKLLKHPQLPNKQFGQRKLFTKTRSNSIPENCQLNKCKLTVTSAPIERDIWRSNKFIPNSNNYEIPENINEFKELLNSHCESSLQSENPLYQVEKKEIKSDVQELFHFSQTPRPNSTQIYATVNPINKLKKMFACQNTECRNFAGNSDKENICLCDHCAIMGVVVDSQKRPFPTIPLSTPQSPLVKKECRPVSPNVEKHRSSYIKQRTNSHDHSTATLIQELLKRMDRLETRLSEQEQRSVPKDYFKRFIGKFMSGYDKKSVSESSNTSKNISTQYNYVDSSNRSVKLDTKQKNVKYRNVQIQQNERRHFTVHSALVNINPRDQLQQTNLESEFLKTEDHENVQYEYKNKKKLFDYEIVSNFLHWGEEIIKPGFDLKTKVQMLVEEHFKNIKTRKQTDKNVNVQITKNSSTSNNHIPELLKKRKLTSNKKLENSNFNKTNTDLSDFDEKRGEQLKQHLSSIYKTTKELFGNVEDFENDTSKKSLTKDVIPESCSKMTHKTASYSKKSAIPVRIINVTMDDSLSSTQDRSNKKKQSGIPRLKSLTKKESDEIPSSEMLTRKVNYESLSSNRSFHSNKNYCTRSTFNNFSFMEEKEVEIKYFNPKSYRWKNDSSTSLKTMTSCDTTK